MLLSNRINQIQVIVDDYQSQIEELNRKIRELQAHAQQVQSVESAMESAAQQVQNALAMLRQICPDEEAGFKAVMDECFAGRAIAELPPIEAKAEPVEEPAPTPAEPSQDTPQVESESVSESATNGNGHRYLSYGQLIQLDRKVLLKLIETKGIEISGTKTTKRLATLLADKVTQADLN